MVCIFTFESVCYLRGFSAFCLFCFLVRNLTFTKENQLWTAYHFDPPPHISGQGYTLVDDHFHWTANYRRDADIYLPFGRFYPKSESQNDDVSLDDIRSSLR